MTQWQGVSIFLVIALSMPKAAHPHRPSGGVLTATRRELRAQLLHAHFEEDHHHIAITLGSWILLNSYIPPRPNLLEQALTSVNEILSAHRANAGSRPWLWTGDFNHSAAQVQTAANLHDGSLLQAQTAWKGTYSIDQIWTNRGDLTRVHDISTERISNHKALQYSIEVLWKEATHRDILRQHHQWTPPPGMQTKDWRKQVEITVDRQSISPTRQALATAM